MSVLMLLIASGVFCAGIASVKGRGAFGWFVLGFLFPLISLLALIALPAAAPKEGKLNFER